MVFDAETLSYACLNALFLSLTRVTEQLVAFSFCSHERCRLWGLTHCFWGEPEAENAPTEISKRIWFNFVWISFHYHGSLRQHNGLTLSFRVGKQKITKNHLLANESYRAMRKKLEQSELRWKEARTHGKGARRSQDQCSKVDWVPSAAVPKAPFCIQLLGWQNCQVA